MDLRGYSERLDSIEKYYRRFKHHKTKNCFGAILMFQRKSSSYFPYKSKGLLLKNGEEKMIIVSMCFYMLTNALQQTL